MENGFQFVKIWNLFPKVLKRFYENYLTQFLRSMIIGIGMFKVRNIKKKFLREALILCSVVC